MKTRGEKVIAFIERYCLAPEGDHIGKPIVLEEFQRKFILEIYDNPYVTHTAYLSIARKNGKTLPGRHEMTSGCSSSVISQTTR